METASSVMALLQEMNEDIDVTMDEVRENISDSGYNSYMPITLAEDISETAVEAIKNAGYKGVNISTNYVREYPNGAFASHILGYLGRITPEEEEEYVDEKGYRKDALIGKDGIEKKYEQHLKGTDSVSKLQVDSSGDVTKILGKSEVKKGRDQQMSYAENTGSGAAVAIDVKTGEVLSMASFPDFDPNDFAISISEEKWASLQQENPYDPLSPSPMYNVAAMTAVQPGSTFKPVTALAAMSCGLDENKYLYDDGAITLGGRSYGCFLWNDEKDTHGYVSLKEALKVSCNYYFYDIAAGKDFASDKSLDYDKTINNDTILKYAKDMGLGQKTGIEINESSGTIPSETLKAEGIKMSLTNYLLAEEETYFVKDTLKDRKQTRKNIEKIVKWSDKDLTLEEIIGKLTKENFVKEDKIEELASVCKYTYFQYCYRSGG